MSTQRDTSTAEGRSSGTRSSTNKNNPASANKVEQSSNLQELNSGILRYVNPHFKYSLDDLIYGINLTLPRVIYNTRNNSADRAILLGKVMIPLIIAQAIVSPSDAVMTFAPIPHSVLDDNQLLKLVLRLAVYIQNKSYRQFFRLLPDLQAYFIHNSKSNNVDGEWANGVHHLLSELQSRILRLSLRDISKSYTAINVDEIEVGYDVENLLPILMSLKWNYDNKTRLAYPFKIPTIHSTTRRK